MVVAVVRALVRVPEWSSLKEKRRFVNSVKDRARRGFGVSAAETGLQDERNACELGFALASSDGRTADRTVQALREFLQTESADRVAEFTVDIEHW